jgi:hypothetical protein
VLLLEVLGLLILLLVLLLFGVYLRRVMLRRGGGTIELSLRMRASAPHGGWVLGVGQFVGDELRWYRVFSLAPRPRRRMSRRDLQVERRREPVGGETLALMQGSVVMELSSADGAVALAMEPRAVTGFLAWLEGTAPGSTLPR